MTILAREIPAVTLIEGTCERIRWGFYEQLWAAPAKSQSQGSDAIRISATNAHPDEKRQSMFHAEVLNIVSSRI